MGAIGEAEEACETSRMNGSGMRRRLRKLGIEGGNRRPSRSLLVLYRDCWPCICLRLIDSYQRAAKDPSGAALRMTARGGEGIKRSHPGLPGLLPPGPGLFPSRPVTGTTPTRLPGPLPFGPLAFRASCPTRPVTGTTPPRHPGGGSKWRAAFPAMPFAGTWRTFPGRQFASGRGR